MFSVRLKASLAAVALAGVAFAIPTAVEAGVVVKSSGPSSSDYPVGQQIDDDASITLRAGDRITVLTDDGTRAMQGPGQFRVGEGATRTRARFSNLTRSRAARRVRTGAVRGAEGGEARNPNLWFVNIAAPGNVCLLDLEAIRLWRPDAEFAETYSIVDQSNDRSLDVAFVETEAVRALDPEAIAITEGAEYSILAPAGEGENGERPSVNVRFLTLDEDGDYSRPTRLAAALYEKGCTTQLALLADTLETAAR